MDVLIAVSLSVVTDTTNNDEIGRETLSSELCVSTLNKRNIREARMCVYEM